MPICSYCGGNDHHSSACVKRAQDQTTHAIEKMGYQQLSVMDKFASEHRESLEMISSGFDHMSNRVTQSLGEASDAIHELSDIFEFNHSEMMWELERQREVLTGIDYTLKNPRATLAEESFKIGVEDLKVGMVEESIRDLKVAVEANPLDYRIYIAMGYAYLRIDDLKNALDRFEYALKNARTDYYRSYSLLLIGRVYYCMGHIEKAVESAKLAIKHSPDYPEAHYQYAAYIAQNRRKRLTG
jgi:tetratricopeptide (TPR) repeat protein